MMNYFIRNDVLARHPVSSVKFLKEDNEQMRVVSSSLLGFSPVALPLSIAEFQLVPLSSHTTRIQKFGCHPLISTPPSPKEQIRNRVATEL